jgi:hypothetical protein
MQQSCATGQNLKSDPSDAPPLDPPTTWHLPPLTRLATSLSTAKPWDNWSSFRARTLTVLDLPSALKLTPLPALLVEYTNPDLRIFLVHADNSAVDPDPEIAECLGFNTVATCCRNPHAHKGSATLGSRLSPALPRVSRPANPGTTDHHRPVWPRPCIHPIE